MYLRCRHFLHVVILSTLTMLTLSACGGGSSSTLPLSEVTAKYISITNSDNTTSYGIFFIANKNLHFSSEPFPPVASERFNTIIFTTAYIRQ